jgi:hypothetical protein
VDRISEWIVAVAGVGTAAMGLVQAMKGLSIGRFGLGLVGLGKIERHLGPAAVAALEVAYGRGAGRELLEGAWQDGAARLAETLRNGMRMAIFADEQREPVRLLIESLGHDANSVLEAVRALRAAGEGEPSLGSELGRKRELVARVEASIDARVAAAVAAGQHFYAASMQLAAMSVALVGCVLVAVVPADDALRPSMFTAVIVGLLAVPIAPLAKDLLALLNSIRGSLERRA